MSSVNIKTLAKELGLSVSTVSRALRDAHDISQQTKKKVQAYAAKRNYVANPYASSLRQQKSKTIGVVIPNVVNNFFALAINGIEAVAQQKNYHVLVYLTHEDQEKEKSILTLLQSGRVDGILLSMASETKDISHLLSFQKTGLPLVFFDRVGLEIDAPKVSTDDYISAFKATEHLIQNGCRTIAYLGISRLLSISQERFKGYRDALAKNAIPLNPSFILDCDENSSLCPAHVATLFTSNNRPDGCFAAVEKLALVAYQVCEELALNIPADLKIVSFSNLPTAALLNPSLTTVTQPAYEIGRKAALLLFQRLEKKRSSSPNETVVIKSELIPRKSSAVT